MINVVIPAAMGSGRSGRCTLVFSTSSELHDVKTFDIVHLTFFRSTAGEVF